MSARVVGLDGKPTSKAEAEEAAAKREDEILQRRVIDRKLDAVQKIYLDLAKALGDPETRALIEYDKAHQLELTARNEISWYYNVVLKRDNNGAGK